MADQEIIDNVLKDKELAELQAEKETSDNTVPELKALEVETAITLLKDIEKNNGYHGIGRLVGISHKRVRLIHERVKAKISDLTKDIEPIGDGEDLGLEIVEK